MNPLLQGPFALEARQSPSVAPGCVAIVNTKRSAVAVTHSRPLTRGEAWFGGATSYHLVTTHSEPTFVDVEIDLAPNINRASVKVDFVINVVDAVGFFQTFAADKDFIPEIRQRVKGLISAQTGRWKIEQLADLQQTVREQVRSMDMGPCLKLDVTSVDARLDSETRARWLKTENTKDFLENTQLETQRQKALEEQQHVIADLRSQLADERRKAGQQREGEMQKMQDDLRFERAKKAVVAMNLPPDSTAYLFALLDPDASPDMLMDRMERVGRMQDDRLQVLIDAGVQLHRENALSDEAHRALMEDITTIRRSRLEAVVDSPSPRLLEERDEVIDVTKPESGTPEQEDEEEGDEEELDAPEYDDIVDLNKEEARTETPAEKDETATS